MKKTESERELMRLASEFETSELTDVSIKEIADKIKLSRIEREKLEEFILSGQDLSAYNIDKVLEQYLQGNDAYELGKLFPDIPVGAIIYAKIKYKWPELRRNFLDNLQYSTRLKAVQTKFQTVNYLATIVNAFMAKNMEGALQYAMSGGKDDSGLLARFKINDFKKLSSYMSLIAKAGEMPNDIGKEKEKDEGNQQTVNIQAENVTVRNQDMEQASQEAGDLLKRFYHSKDQK